MRRKCSAVNLCIKILPSRNDPDVWRPRIIDEKPAKTGMPPDQQQRLCVARNRSRVPRNEADQWAVGPNFIAIGRKGGVVSIVAVSAPLDIVFRATATSLSRA